MEESRARSLCGTNERLVFDSFVTLSLAKPSSHLLQLLSAVVSHVAAVILINLEFLGAGIAESLRSELHR